jgi:hypothetical protein
MLSRKMGVVVVVVAAVALALLAVALRASTSRPWAAERACGKKGDGYGSLTVNLRWGWSDPLQVAMSYETARSIARHVGPDEFDPPDSHPLPQDVPCDVAGSVAFTAADSWSKRQQTSAWIAAGWRGYAVGPSYRFHCVVSRPTPAAVDETCVHRADRRAGEIRVRFTAHRFHMRA